MPTSMHFTGPQRATECTTAPHHSSTRSTQQARRAGRAQERLRNPQQCRAQQQGQQQQQQLQQQQGKQQDKGWASSPLSIFCPLLKLVSGGDAAAPRPRFLEVLTSGLASLSRLPFGTSVGPDSARRTRTPEKPIYLYEFEACPFCRRVREAVADLDLENVHVRPCPKDAAVHRPEVEARGGRTMFPFLVDENTGRELYESDAIVNYLYETYGAEGQRPPRFLLQSTLVSGWVPTLLRAGRGMSRYEGARPAPPRELRLFSYENNQFARLVREALCELELPYELVSVAKGSRRRDALRDLDVEASVPYLVDDNTSTQLGESEEIVAYLFRTYGQPA